MSYSYFNGEVRGSNLLAAARNTANLTKYADECKAALQHRKVKVKLSETTSQDNVGLFARAASITRCTLYAIGEGVEHGLHPKAVKGLEGLKLINIFFIPSTLVRIAKPLIGVLLDNNLTTEEKIDKGLSFLGSTASLLDSSAAILEAFISIGSLQGRVCVAADALNNLSSVMGLVSYVVDVKTIFEANRGLNKLKKADDIDPKIKEAFAKRFHYIVFNSFLSMSSATLANAATVHLNKGTSIAAAWALLAGAGVIGFAAWGIDVGADYMLAKDIRAAMAA